MHFHDLSQWKHLHRFHAGDTVGERNTRLVAILTLLTMAVEITAGMLFHSMALLADGWHMGTHAVALGIALFAYRYARRHADDPRHTFGTGKVGVLAGFTSAILLAVVAVLMGVESTRRFIAPQQIRFNDAIIVAVIGLAVNLLSALLLQSKGHHAHSEHEEDPHHQKHAHHGDHNLRAAYMHVLADAFTSVLAIAALLTGKYLGWIFMDPVMGMVGALLISRWSYGLIRDTGRILLDSDVNPDISSSVRKKIEDDGDNRVSDLHVWRVGSHHLAAIVSVVTNNPRNPEHYKKLLAGIQDLKHVSVEVHRCCEEKHD